MEELIKFLMNLSEEECLIIGAHYLNPYFNGFDDLVKENFDNPSFQKKLSIYKKLAAFENKYNFKLHEALNIPKLPYTYGTEVIYKSILLEVRHCPNCSELTQLFLGKNEQRLLHDRDKKHAGSWGLLKRNVASESDLNMINKLIKYEQTHKINLGVLMREQFPLEQRKSERS